MPLPLKKTLLIAVAILLVSGVGYAGWKHFFSTFSEEELENFISLAFESTGTKYCTLPRPGVSDFSFYEPRYFVVATEKELNRLNKKLGYTYLTLSEYSFDTVTNFERDFIVGGLQSLRDEERGRLSIKSVYRKGNKIVIKIASIIEGFPIRFPTGDVTYSYSNCVYDLAKISRNDLTPGINLFYFLDDHNKLLKLEMVLIK